jgi:hypothetical protein
MRSNIVADLITREKETVTLASNNLPLDEYVVLNTSHNLSFAGVLQGRLQLENEEGILVRLDEKTRFTIWCPIAHVQRLLVVPIR